MTPEVSHAVPVPLSAAAAAGGPAHGAEIPDSRDYSLKDFCRSVELPIGTFGGGLSNKGYVQQILTALLMMLK